MIYGWGINDVALPTTKAYRSEDGRCIQYWMCPIYSDWKNMVCRVYGKYKTTFMYEDVQIYKEWKYFSNFRRWVLEEQPNKNWENCCLDKDLLVKGNKIYSPETCVFVTNMVNTFINHQKHTRGMYLIGVSYQPKNTLLKFTASCRNPFNRNAKTHLGSFLTELEAHKAWQAKKHEYACQLADLQQDLRVADALRQRYAPDRDLTK